MEHDLDAIEVELRRQRGELSELGQHAVAHVSGMMLDIAAFKHHMPDLSAEERKEIGAYLRAELAAADKLPQDDAIQRLAVEASKLAINLGLELLEGHQTLN